MAEPIEPGRVRLVGVSRRFKVLHDKSSTLKEVLIRRQRAVYTEFLAVSNISLDIAPGESVGIVGRNGSGKSTLLKMLAGIIPPHEGTVETGGVVASMLELGAGFHPDFTGRENIFMNAAIHGIAEKAIAERIDEIIDFAEVRDFIDMPVRTYSSGMSMRLAFAVSSHVDPDILLLDEVLAVGDEAFQGKCLERMFAYRRRGGTIVFVSHDPNAVEQICDRAILIADGEMLDDGPPSRILATYHRRLAAAAAVTDETAADVEVLSLGTDDAPGPTTDDSTQTEDDPRQWGNQRALITRAELVGANGPQEAFVSGEEVAVHLTVQAVKQLVNPIFGVQIHGLDRTLCYETHSGLDQVSFPSLPAGSVVEVRFAIPRLHIHSGRFTVSMAVSDDGILCHHLERWLEFGVFSSAKGHGLIDLSGAWSLQLVTPGSANGPTVLRQHSERTS